MLRACIHAHTYIHTYTPMGLYTCTELQWSARTYIELLEPDISQHIHTHIHTHRGNHENKDINLKKMHEGGGFQAECVQKYGGITIFMYFQQLFEVLPIATIVQNKVFVVHGGLSRHDVKIKEIRELRRKRQCPCLLGNREDELMFDCLWADPLPDHCKGLMTSGNRGPNCIRFGKDVTHRFLQSNDLKLCVRSHEVPDT